MKFKNSSMHNDLLLAAHHILVEEGIDYISIRHLSERTGIATGTIYNYFSSKDEILLALTTEYWQQAIEEIRQKQGTSFLEHVLLTHQVLNNSIQQHGRLLMKQLGNAQHRGVATMKGMHQQLKEIMLTELNKDQRVITRWNDTFTSQHFIDFVLSNILISLKKEETDLTVFTHVLNRILYEAPINA